MILSLIVQHLCAAVTGTLLGFWLVGVDWIEPWWMLAGFALTGIWRCVFVLEEIREGRTVDGRPLR